MPLFQFQLLGENCTEHFLTLASFTWPIMASMLKKLRTCSNRRDISSTSPKKKSSRVLEIRSQRKVTFNLVKSLWINWRADLLKRYLTWMEVVVINIFVKLKMPLDQGMNDIVETFVGTNIAFEFLVHSQNEVFELREAFDVCRVDEKATFPDSLVPKWRGQFSTLAENLKLLTRRLLKALALSLDLDPEFFVRCHRNLLKQGNWSILRSLFYPPIQQGTWLLEVLYEIPIGKLGPRFKRSSSYNYLSIRSSETRHH